MLFADRGGELTMLADSQCLQQRQTELEATMI